jgi:omega-amidase
MLVAAVQYDIAWEDKPANHRIVEDLLADAALPRGTLVVLPELGDTGFSFDLDTIVDERTRAWAIDLARALGIWLQVGYAVRGPDGRGRNCAAVISPERDVIGEYRKVHPFSYGREIEHFSGGNRLLVCRCGDAVICPLICYDLRFPELWRLGAAEGAELFTIGASWPNARQAHWRTLNIARAIENQAAVVAVNRVGDDPHLSYDGWSMIISHTGEILAEAGDEPAVLTAEIDLAALRRWRADFPALEDMKSSLLGRIEVDRPVPVDR